MVDDNTATENTEEVPEGEEQSPDESGFSDAFDAAISDDPKAAEAKAAENKEADADAGKDGDKEADASKDEKDPDKKADDDKGADADKDAEAKAKEEADAKAIEDAKSDEEKEADKRGQELIEEEEEATKEADKKAEEDKQKLADEEAAKEAGEITPMTADQVKTFVELIPPSEWPDTLEIDGVELDIKEYLTDYPEVQAVSGFVTQKVIERLVKNGVLITAEQNNAKMNDIERRLYGLHFDTTVMRAIPDAMQITETKEYEAWMKDKATKEDLALLGSVDPADYILGLNKYKSFSSPASDKSKEDAKKKAQEEKDKHDSIHSSTMDASHKSGAKGSMDGGNDAFGDAFKEAEDAAEKEKK